MFRFQRTIDEDGFYLAQENDFRAAEDLFKDKDAEELVKRLTKKERELAEIITKSKTGINREEAAQKMKISVQRISQLINGEKGKGGLMSKLPGLIVEDTVDTEKDDLGSKSIRHQVLKLNGYIPLDGFGKVVVLKDDETDMQQPNEDENDPDFKGFKDDLREDLRKPILRNSNNREERERENTTRVKDKSLREREIFSFEKKENISFSLPKKSLNSLNDGDASRKDTLKSPFETNLNAENNPLSKQEKEMLAAMDADFQKEEKFKTPVKCYECGNSVTKLYDIGKGEFAMSMCKTCYDAYLDDISNV
jgi:hypothetical protein